MNKTDQTMTNPEENPIADTVISNGSYQAVKLNAITHGILSHHTVLPHEDANKYSELLLLLNQEHKPQGMTEAHLVEELAGVMWRKQRVLQAEGAKINEGLNAISNRSGSVYSDALPFHSGMSKDDIKLYDLLRMNTEEVIEFQQSASNELQDIQKAIQTLERNSSKAYKQALDLLCDEDREWWAELVESEESEANTEDLLVFIMNNLKPWYEHQLTLASHHAEIKAQGLGEGVQPHRLVILNRYETHLDRKFQRTLAMLIKLKELRNN